jgi:hypothetical protein
MYLRSLAICAAVKLPCSAAQAVCSYSVFTGTQGIANAEDFDVVYDIKAKTFKASKAGVVLKTGELETICDGNTIVFNEIRTSNNDDGSCTMRPKGPSWAGTCIRRASANATMSGTFY